MAKAAVETRSNRPGTSQNDKPLNSAKIMGDPLIIMDLNNPIRANLMAKIAKFASMAITI